MMTLDQTFSALADPTRRTILARLAQGEATVGELAEPFAISLPAISRHLRVLEDASLIVRERQGQHRVCRLQPEPLANARDRKSTRLNSSHGSISYAVFCLKKKKKKKDHYLPKKKKKKNNPTK